MGSATTNVVFGAKRAYFNVLHSRAETRRSFCAHFTAQGYFQNIIIFFTVGDHVFLSCFQSHAEPIFLYHF